MADRTLIVGLGNPGPEYERTRHNLGFLVLDELADRLGTKKFKRSKQYALVAESRDEDVPLILAKPQTYMNESGRAVAALARYHRIANERVVVVHDELDLPLGTVRVKLGGGTAGHNGIADVVSAIGPDFARVRLGIGRPAGSKDPVRWVLESFSKKESEQVPGIVDLGADAVQAILREGISAAQTSFNKRAQ